MEDSSLNDTQNERNQYGIMQTFAKTISIKYENIKEVETEDFSFKKDLDPQEQTIKDNLHSPGNDKIKSLVSRIDFHVSNKDLLYSGHFGPCDNKNKNKDNTHPFASIREGNLDQSFLTTTSSTLLHHKSFANLCKNITIDKAKKKKMLKSTEQLEIEKIMLEKDNMKKIMKKNMRVLEKNCSFISAKNQNVSYSSQLSFDNSKFTNDTSYLSKKRCKPFPSKSKSKSKIKKIILNKSLKEKNIKSKTEMDELTRQLATLGLDKSLSRSVSPDEQSKDIKKNATNNKHIVNTYSTSIRKAFIPIILTEQNESNAVTGYKFKSQPLYKDKFKQKLNIVSFDALIKQAKDEKKQIDSKDLKMFKLSRDIKFKQSQATKSTKSSKLSKADKENVAMN